MCTEIGLSKTGSKLGGGHGSERAQGIRMTQKILHLSSQIGESSDGKLGTNDKGKEKQQHQRHSQAHHLSRFFSPSLPTIAIIASIIKFSVP